MIVATPPEKTSSSARNHSTDGAGTPSNEQESVQDPPCMHVPVVGFTTTVGNTETQSQNIHNEDQRRY